MSPDKQNETCFELSKRIRFYHLENRLVVADEYIRLEDKVSQVLQCLIEHRGHVVSREFLLERVWNEVIVSDDVITQSIYKLRKYFGKDESGKSLIETIPKRGYKLTLHTVAANKMNGGISTNPKRLFNNQYGYAITWSVACAVVLATGIIWALQTGDTPVENGKRYKASMTMHEAGLKDSSMVIEKMSISIKRDELSADEPITMDQLKEIARTLAGDSLGTDVTIYEEKASAPNKRE